MPRPEPDTASLFLQVSAAISRVRAEAPSNAALSIARSDGVSFLDLCRQREACYPNAFIMFVHWGAGMLMRVAAEGSSMRASLA